MSLHFYKKTQIYENINFFPFSSCIWHNFTISALETKTHTLANSVDQVEMAYSFRVISCRSTLFAILLQILPDMPLCNNGKCFLAGVSVHRTEMITVYVTVNPLYTNVQYHDKARQNDSWNVTKPQLKMRYLDIFKNIAVIIPRNACF